MILSKINKGVYLSLFKHANTRKHVYEYSCLSVRVFMSILAHLAHFAQSFFLISTAINELIFDICKSKQIHKSMPVSMSALL